MVCLLGLFKAQLSAAIASKPIWHNQPSAHHRCRDWLPLLEICPALQMPAGPRCHSKLTAPGRAFGPRLVLLPLLDAYFRFRDGTPGSQIVTERFEVTWESVMVSSHNAIVLKFDGRGSGFQGTKLLHEVKRRLGLLEEKDQLEAVRWMTLLLKKLIH